MGSMSFGLARNMERSAYEQLEPRPYDEFSEPWPFPRTPRMQVILLSGAKVYECIVGCWKPHGL